MEPSKELEEFASKLDRMNKLSAVIEGSPRFLLDHVVRAARGDWRPLQDELKVYTD